MFVIDPHQPFPVAQTGYQQQALDFCKQWLAGQSSFVLHTSGSTGTPKPITLTRTQMQASAWLTGKTFSLEAGQHVLVCVNIGYIAGVMMLVRGLSLGLKMTLVAPSANPFKDNEELLTQTFDFTALVPLQIQKIIDDGNHAQLNAMRAIIVGGAAVNQALQEQIQTLTVPVFSTYGMTETVSHIAIRRLNGKPTNDYFTALEDVQLALDDRGCLQICCAASNHEWITTNDLAVLHDTQHFSILGRYDNIINSGGVKIQLEKVEQAYVKAWLEVCPSDVMPRFFAYGLPDERLGQRLVLFQESPPLDAPQADALQLILAKLLQKYEIPKQVYYLSRFSNTATEKIDKISTIKSLHL